MHPFLETERLVLRGFTPDDVDGLVALDSDPEVMRFINGGEPADPALIRTQTLPRLLHDYPVLSTRGYWAAEEKAARTFLGWFELRPLEEHSAAVVELGYRLHRAAWGKGYATEGCRALVATAFTGLGVERITANTMAVNTGSRRVMEKLGMTFVRSFTGDWPVAIPGSEHGEVEYELTREDWLRSERSERRE